MLMLCSCSMPGDFACREAIMLKRIRKIQCDVTRASPFLLHYELPAPYRILLSPISVISLHIQVQIPLIMIAKIKLVMIVYQEKVINAGLSASGNSK